MDMVFGKVDFLLWFMAFAGSLIFSLNIGHNAFMDILARAVGFFMALLCFSLFIVWKLKP